ncbi:hypothetical protein [Pseudoalteromonas sp. MMG012]|uniref:hypothetical protein n=1 Tax=Pseudoalteromonas sp. MMG012 TaxID=2822686 RepID=UPI001B3A2521|nr:hypothetical protein [Pseudoalteromonas sp. MMG012]MBQ4852179.1 hypothetical protein [Pseudoalteromonas sp. MMG012]
MKNTLVAIAVLMSFNTLSADLTFQNTNEMSYAEINDVRNKLSDSELLKFDNAVNMQMRMAVVYNDMNYRSQYRVIVEDTPDFRVIGFNDNTTAIKVYNAIGVTVYQKANYGGQYRTIIGDLADFRLIGFNDDTSSMKFF